MSYFVFVAAFLLLSTSSPATVVAQEPPSILKFQASYEETTTTSLGDFLPPGGVVFPPTSVNLPPLPILKRVAEAVNAAQAGVDIATQTKGTIYVDQIGRVMRMNLNELRITIGGSVLTQQTGLHANNMLLFDAGRNLTWSGSSCGCDPIEGSTEMPDFTPPPRVLATGTGVSITVGGSPVSTTYYSFGVQASYGSASSATLTYEIWVDSNKYTRRAKFVTNAAGLSVTYQIDFWNVANLTSAAVLPPAICADKCKSATVIGVTAPTSYPAASVTCSTSNSKCLCQTVITTNNAFCGAIVNYPVSQDLYVAISNEQAQFSFNAAIQLNTGLSQSCKDALKEYFCRFYLPWCDATEKKPALPTCLSADDKKTLYSSGDSAFASYSAIDGATAAGAAPVKSAASSLSSSLIFATTLASLALVTFLL